MSQLGTRISGWLGDDDDIRAVLSGLAGRDALRGMLARLQPKEEVLLLGWGVPMPLLVRSRRYDDIFWSELLDENEQDVLSLPYVVLILFNSAIRAEFSLHASNRLVVTYKLGKV